MKYKNTKDMKDIAWALLAAAIIQSGKDANDTAFLESKWCESLKYMVSLKYNKRQGYKENIQENSKYVD